MINKNFVLVIVGMMVAILVVAYPMQSVVALPSSFMASEHTKPCALSAADTKLFNDKLSFVASEDSDDADSDDFGFERTPDPEDNPTDDLTNVNPNDAYPDLSSIPHPRPSSECQPSYDSVYDSCAAKIKVYKGSKQRISQEAECHEKAKRAFNDCCGIDGCKGGIK
jgi:hypothetical protein